MQLPPSLAELTEKFLRSEGADAFADSADVEPYEVAGGFRTPVRDVWRDSLAVFPMRFQRAAGAVPPEWANYVTLDTGAGVAPFAAGFFPQRLRHIGTLHAQLVPGDAVTVAGFPALRKWSQAEFRSGVLERVVLASGVAAGLGDLAQAEAALNAVEPQDGPTRVLWLNQVGAVAWLAGRADDAVVAWTEAGEFAPARFNLGLAALAAGDEAAALGQFEATVLDTPEQSGWNHLAQLCLALTSRID